MYMVRLVHQNVTVKCDLGCVIDIIGRMEWFLCHKKDNVDSVVQTLQMMATYQSSMSDVRILLCIRIM